MLKDYCWLYAQGSILFINAQENWTKDDYTLYYLFDSLISFLFSEKYKSQKFFIWIFFWGGGVAVVYLYVFVPHPSMLSITPGSALRNHSEWWLGNLVEFWGINPSLQSKCPTCSAIAVALKKLFSFYKSFLQFPKVCCNDKKEELEVEK